MKRRAFVGSTVACVATYATSARAVAAGAAVAAPPVESAYDLDTATGTIRGSLVRAEGSGPTPLVLLVAGSGPTDRDGNSKALPGSNDALKLLANACARAGVATLRYDKRGVGASALAAPSERALTIDTYADDAAAWILKLRADGRFSKIVLGGHSEGALVATLAARLVSVDGLALLAGAGRPAGAVLREQFKTKLPPALFATADGIIAKLEARQLVRDTPPELDALFRSSAQPYLISWFAYDPAREFGALKIPRAIVAGTADVQIASADREALASAAPDARLVVVDGMNHVLKHVPDVSSQAAIVAGYSDPSLPIEPQVTDAIVTLATT